MTKSLRLDWKRCRANDDNPETHWCSFMDLNLDNLKDRGVYIIWLGKTVIYVGQGDVADRIGEHQLDSRFHEYTVNQMLVTWAVVPLKTERNGIERYLAETWQPAIGEQWPDAEPITVNSPWS